MAAKFTFDTNFDAGAAHAGAVAAARTRRSYTAAEIDAIRAEAYESGRRSAEVRALDHLAAAAAQVAAAIIGSARDMDGEIERVRAESAELALQCAKTMAGAALSHAPEAEIAETLRAALHQAIAETHVTVKTAPPLAHTLDGKAAEIAAQEGFEGRVRFTADPSLHGADCRIEWRGGGIERNIGQIADALSGIIARRFPPQDKE